jgi:hypothetical protein
LIVLWVMTKKVIRPCLCAFFVPLSSEVQVSAKTRNGFGGGVNKKVL